MRDVHTPNAAFRQALDALASMLIYEATRDLPMEIISLETPIQTTTGVRLARGPMLVPILRAAVGMVDAALRLLPEAEVGFVGLARDEATFQPRPYLAKLPERLDGRPVITLDPMLATGGSLAYTLELLVARGAPQPITCISVLAAPEGLARLQATGLDLHVVTAAIDSHLNDNAYIVPGLGDAGDRQFGLW